ncbi:MAG: D-2-hydroxyacid dehydrogenase [Gemmatimonadetes bacterium]|nr:D-2-hydroxyacid dehydrogenase [Gemmatimonadota bacterium]MYH20529.1 D-2-hydroxyacid dehydrogenase [Gemmatimonadota bacterium]MYK97934.1 D-2-hydroxyacid dehydrogenase [Gemmatimonadota bacterium]
MNVLLRMNLIEPLVDEIRQVDGKVRVIRVDSEEEALEVMPEIEVVCGEITRALFARRRKLAWIQSWGAGVDGLLYPELVESDVVLCSAKGFVGVHLADHAMALLLALTRGIHTAIRNPGWNPRWPIRDASWELVDRTMGIVGLGGTGRELARRAVAFGMRVVAVDLEDVEVPAEVEACWGMDRFHALLEQSDVVAVCAPLTAETEALFDREAFARMPDHALLINVTRGRIVDEAALLEALECKRIGGAGLDVVPQEPLPGDHPLWKMENVVITPHTAGGSPNRDGRCVALFCENLRRYLDGRPLTSVIDKRKGY